MAAPARRAVVGMVLAFALGALLGSNLPEANAEPLPSAASVAATVMSGAVSTGPAPGSEPPAPCQPERARRAWSARLTREAVERWGLPVAPPRFATAWRVDGVNEKSGRVR
jgi:hypothetical protein